MTTTHGENHDDVATVDLTDAERVIVRLEQKLFDEDLLTLGRYAEVRGDIFKGWFEHGEPFVGEQEMLVVRADRFKWRGNIWAREGVTCMLGHGYRPPTMREFLAFGAQDLPDKWVGADDKPNVNYDIEPSKWYYVIGANLHFRQPEQPQYDLAPAIWSHSGKRGLTIASMYNAMLHAWPRNPHYLWVPLP